MFTSAVVRVVIDIYHFNMSPTHLTFCLQKIHDSQLLVSVAILLCVDICVLVIKYIIDQPYLKFHRLPKEVSETISHIAYLILYQQK